jgi:hypothetical protein
MTWSSIPQSGELAILQESIHLIIVHCMNDYTLESTRGGRQRQGGPPLVLLGTPVLGFFVAGMIISAALGGRTPNPLGDPDNVLDFYRHHQASALAGGVCLFAASVPLLIYAATVSARLRQLGITAPGATIALVGGVSASVMLGASALLAWTLAQPTVSADDAVVHALSVLSFLTGGVGHVVPLGLLLAGVSVPALIVKLLPRAVAIVGLVIAVIAELSTLSLVFAPLAILLPLARFPALIWLVVAGALLPTTRRKANA